jgi:hypothetical protein
VAAAVTTARSSMLLSQLLCAGDAMKQTLCLYNPIVAVTVTMFVSSVSVTVTMLS